MNTCRRVRELADRQAQLMWLAILACLLMTALWAC